MTLSVILVPKIFLKIADNPTYPSVYNVTHVEFPLVSVQFIDQSYAELPIVAKIFFNLSGAFLTKCFFLFA